MGASVTRRPIVDRDGRPAEDDIAVEEPLEIRVQGETIAVTLRTPGDDVALGLGFLYAEGLIRSVDDVGTARHCGRTDGPDYGNVLEVTPAAGAHAVFKRLDHPRRLTITTSACGLCGRQTIDDLLALVGPQTFSARVPAALIARAPELLRAVQPAFGRTGALHGAAVVTLAGEVLSSGEDVGRHNAIDKALGHLLREGRLGPRGLATPSLLVVSGRAGFDVVQKAAMARLDAVVSVSAATSLAIDLAQRVGLLLTGFTREGRFTVYTHPERLLPG